ncbi:MAG: phosphatase PAP2 family protein [Alphaproteobacteria bacterium]
MIGFPPSVSQQLAFLARLGRREIGLIAGLFVVAALILGFGLLADEVVEGDTAAFDEAILLAFRTPGDTADPIGPPWLEEFGRDVTALGSYAFLGFLFLAMVGYLLLIRKRHLAVLMSVSVLGGEVLSNVLKIGFGRPRPELVAHGAQVFTASFPSGHAMLSAVTFLTIGALLTRVHTDRRLDIYFMALAVLLTIAVGLSRVYLGVHYPTDVLAGWCLGAAWAALCWVVALWLQARGEVEPESGDPRPDQG